MKSDIISAALLSAFSRTCFVSTIIFSKDWLVQFFHPFCDNVHHTHTLIKASINQLRLSLRLAFKITVKSISRGEGGGFSDLNSDLSEGYKRFFDPRRADKHSPVSTDRGRPRCLSPPPTFKKWRTGAVETFLAEIVEPLRQERGHKFAVESSGLRRT